MTFKKTITDRQLQTTLGKLKIVDKIKKSDFGYPSVIVGLIFICGLFVSLISMFFVPPMVGFGLMLVGLKLSSMVTICASIIALIFFRKRTLKHWYLLLLINSIAFFIAIKIIHE